MLNLLRYSQLIALAVLLAVVAALSLLYRGLLSRLAHVHQVRVRESSTEGECLGLARGALPAPRSAYVALLIGTWQRAVYGGMPPQDQAVHELCARFDAELATA